MKNRMIWAAILLAVAMAAGEALGCDGCKSALNSKANVPRFGDGMGYSIYFMLSMPFLIMGSFAGLLWWKTRQARLKDPLKSRPS